MPRSRPLNEKEYLARFRLAARWFLEEPEAAEAVEDYAELLACEAGAPGGPAGRLGGPWQAARLLADKRRYRRWLFAFALLALCVLWPLAGICSGSCPPRLFPFSLLGEPFSTLLFFCLGVLGCLGWFRRRGGRGGPLPKGLPWALAALLAAGCALAGGCFAVCRTLLAWPAGQELPPRLLALAQRMDLLLRWGGAVFGLAAVIFLALARCLDRRWRAAYLLALTLLVLLQVTLVFFGQLSDPAALFLLLQRWLLPLAGAGLLAAGVGLC